MGATDTRPRPGGTYELAGRPVARVGYGAMQLADADHDAAVAVLRRAVELGVNHLDTAAFYGPGTVNALIRDALAPYPDDLVIVSKVGAEHVPGTRPPLAPAQRPEQLRAEVERNLATLGVERVDVVNLRRLDTGPGLRAEGDQDVALEDQLAEMVALRDEGKIGAIGLSSSTADRLRVAIPAGVVCVQNSYSLLDRADEEQVALCREHGIAWVPYFPLGSAFAHLPKVTDRPEVQAAARSAGATAAQVGLAWLLDHAPNVLLIPGTGSVAHLEENVGAARVRLDAATTATLDVLAV